MHDGAERKLDDEIARFFDQVCIGLGVVVFAGLSIWLVAWLVNR